jgi:predicted double-glycine peptidase
VSWQELKSHNVVIQDLDYSCGAAALATLLQYYFRDDVSEEELLDHILGRMSAADVKDRQENGLSMDDLFQAAKDFEYHAAVVRMPVEKLPKLPAPVIVRIEKDDYKHFVVLRGMAEDRIFLADPIRGNVRVSLYTFLQQWSGEALVLGKAGFGLPSDHPLAVHAQYPVRNESSAARRFLYRTP